MKARKVSRVLKRRGGGAGEGGGTKKKGDIFLFIGVNRRAGFDFRISSAGIFPIFFSFFFLVFLSPSSRNH